MHPTGRESGRRAHRLLLFALSALLVGFAIWCVALWRTQAGLRHELDLRLGALEQLRVLDAELFESGPPPRPLSADSDLAAWLGATASGADSPRSRVLADALERLSGAGDDSDGAWEARNTARAASSDLRSLLMSELGSLHRELRSHWRSSATVLVGCLVLAGSNLALLGLAHRRREELTRAHDRLEELATRDPLTGLWNRRAILRQLRREIDRIGRAPTHLGLVLCDLDSFGGVNDLVGRDEADRLLGDLGERLPTRLRAYDHVGRYGGDSFLFVLPTCDGPSTASIAARLSELFDTDFEHRLGRVKLSASFTWLSVHGPVETDSDHLLRVLRNGIDEGAGAGRVVAVEPDV